MPNSKRSVETPILGTEELEELTRFLMSDATPQSVMMLDTTHGYLTALAICPVQLPQAIWLPFVWSDDGSERPQFMSAQQEERIGSFIRRMFESVAMEVGNPLEPFEPVVSLVRHGDKTFRDGRQWAIGFMEGVSLQRAEWSFLDSHMGQEILGPILQLQASEDATAAKMSSVMVEQRDELTAAISDAIENIAQWILEMQLQQSVLVGVENETLISLSFTFGACPCGSGQAIKTCCGAPHRLH